MGRSADKKIPIESSQLMASSFSLLCLPSELLEIIFSYLSSTDIVQSFFDLNSDRIQTLIHYNRVSIVTREEQWIKKYFVDQCRLSDGLISLHLTDKQMSFLSKSNTQFLQLVSLHIINIKDNNLFHIDMMRMMPLLRSLSLNYLADEMSHDSVGCLAGILLCERNTWQAQLQKLLINHIHIPFGLNSLQSMLNLRHLTIYLRYENQLFDLCSYLPNIESFRVDVRRSSFHSSDEPLNFVGTSPYLKKLIISGHFSSHARLYTFILIYQSSLEYLKLFNIDHSDSADGHQLHSELVQYLSPTIHFQFQFQFQVNLQEFSLDNYLKTFDWTQVIIDSKTDDDSTVIMVSSSPTRYSRSYFTSRAD